MTLAKEEITPFTEKQRNALRSIRSLEIKLRKRINQTFVGEHHSVFKGQGMEFNEVRQYIRGDDAKYIDWKVTARTDDLHIKVFQEERELVFNILFDISASQLFGSGSRSKREAASEIAAILAFASIKNRDKIGFLSFTDIPEQYLPPKKERVHAFKIIKESLSVNPINKRSNLKNALQFFGKMQKKTSVLFIISDFLFPDDYQDLLRKLVLKHSIIAIHLQDPLEISLPKLGYLYLSDLEEGGTFMVNTYSRLFRKNYETLNSEKNLKLKKDLQRMKIKYVAIDTSRDYLKDLSDFFRKEIIR